MIVGIESDIIAIKQVDNLTILRTPATEITIHKSIDEITIRDIEDVISGTSNLEVEITALKQVDEITIVKPPATDLTITD